MANARPRGLGDPLDLVSPLVWMQVSASVYADAVTFRLSHLRAPGGRVEILLREKFGREDLAQPASTVASLGLSWWVDQLDTTGRWPAP